MDLKGKKGSTKWAVLYGNLLFTYEGDQPSIKPLAVSILEGCQGYPTPVGDGGELEVCMAMATLIDMVHEASV
jgi:hypothetical protein